MERKIQRSLLDFIDDEENSEEYFENLIKLIDDHKIKQNCHELKSFLYLISNIAANHPRQLVFFSKIDINRFFED